MNRNVPPQSPPLARFIHGMDAMLAAQPHEAEILARCQTLLAELVAHDDWLPDSCAQPHPEHYQQYLLHCAPDDRYCVVSFVWGPGQQTPIHDHGVWGVIGMLRGSELSRHYALSGGRLAPAGDDERLLPGETAVVSPRVGDIHRVWNAYDDRTSISIHVYGTDIGKQARHVYDPGTGTAKRFVSGYANAAPTDTLDGKA